MNRRHAALLALAAMFTLAACGDDTPPPPTFLEGTPSDPGILLAVNLDKALFMLQTGALDQIVEYNPADLVVVQCGLTLLLGQKREEHCSFLTSADGKLVTAED